MFDLSVPTAKSGLPDVDTLTARLFDEGPFGYLICSIDGRLLRINDRLLEWLGFDETDLATQASFADLLYGNDRQLWADRVSTSLAGDNEFHSLRLRMRCADGTAFEALVSGCRQIISPEHDAVDTFVINKASLDDPGVSGHGDPTASLFLSTFSHEILTPLNAILGTANLLGETELNDQQLHLQSIMVRSGHHLLSLFKNILVISQAGLETLQPTEHALRPEELLTAITDSFRYGSDPSDYDFRIEIDEKVPSVLIGDSALLGQVITNLVGNATRHTRQGAVTTGVKLLSQTESKRCRVRFYVADTGVGMEPEVLRNLFTPYHQAFAELKGNYAGGGLGLTICNRILHGYNSKLEVESELGKGSRFWFDLDLGVGKDSDLVVQEFHNLQPIGRGKVLIVDDNKTNSYLVARHFRTWGVEYAMAENGQEALDRLETGRYDIILMDLKMPVMDGYTAARAIRSLPGEQGKIPIIAFSASASLAITERMRDAQIDEFALKPFSPRQLYNLVAKFLKPKSMNYPELRDAMDHDPEDLRNFAAVLQRELAAAADELAVALTNDNENVVGDIKHKLKTSLQLLDAHQLRDDLANVADDMNHARPVSTQRKKAVLEQLRNCVQDLSREAW